MFFRLFLVATLFFLKIETIIGMPVDDSIPIENLDKLIPFDQWGELAEESSDVTLLPDKTASKYSFRLGIELETGILLSEAVAKNREFQKESLFFCLGREKLWHVEIDGVDIEFVSVPFSDSEEDSFADCAYGIQKAAAILREFVNGKNKKTTFKEWFGRLQENGFNLQKENLFRRLENEIIQWKNGEKNWNGTLQPHATVQIPLQHVIELCFELFKNVPSILCIFEGALPFCTREDCDNYFRSSHQMRRTLLANFRNKIDGLMFLQASTLLDLTIPAFIKKTDKELLARLLQDFLMFHQICPKIYLHVMSRRPLSDMLQELGDAKIGYSDLFRSKMSNNILFMDLNKLLSYYNSGGDITIDDDDEYGLNGVPFNFERVCYGQQYFEESSKDVPDLTNIFELRFFKTESHDCDLNELGFLLENGIIMTAMLRSMRMEALIRFGFDKVLHFTRYDSVINSVETPTWRPLLKIIGQNVSIIQDNSEMDEITPHDFLSPPLLLFHNRQDSLKRDCDSIGAYLQTPEKLETNKFGEAIIEIRAIGFAYNESLGGRKVKDGEIVPNLFLSEIEYIESDCRALFRYIGSKSWLY